MIVLGTQVKGETLSRSLEYRMETAVRYAKIHPNTVFILSGGKGKGEDVSEAFAMYEYMKANGIPEYQMILEEQSTSTYENLVVQPAFDCRAGGGQADDHPRRDERGRVSFAAG